MKPIQIEKGVILTAETGWDKSPMGAPKLTRCSKERI